MEQNSVKRSYQEFKVNFDTIINAKTVIEEGDVRMEEQPRRSGARTKQTARRSTAQMDRRMERCMEMESRMEAEQDFY